MGFKRKVTLGCIVLVAIVLGFWMATPNNPSSSVEQQPVVKTAPTVTYTVAEQQSSFKAWMQDFELKTNAVNEQWQILNVLLADTDQDDIYHKLDSVQHKLEQLKGTYSLLEPPATLTMEQQKNLREVASDMDESINERIKFIGMMEEYLLHQRSMMYRQSQQQKELIDSNQLNASSRIKKISETLNIE